MGAAACSDAERQDPARLDAGGAARPGPPSAPGPRAPKAGSAAARAEATGQGARYWHDKMRLSAASQAVFDGAQCGDTRRVLAALNAHGDPNCVNFAGYTALMLAVGGGYREVVALLLQASGDPNYALEGVSPLMIASGGGQLEVARMLVNCGANGASCDTAEGRTALHRASVRGHADVARLLLQAGGSVDWSDFAGRTPLMLAAESGHTDTVRTLLCAGASHALSDKAGDSALTACVAAGHAACLEAMLKAGASVNSASKATGDTGLVAAGRACDDGICRLLLQFQANVNLANNRRETPLMHAARGGAVKVVHALLLAGADTTLQDICGYTALMHAAAGGSPAACSTCMDFGASPLSASPVDSHTPLTVAASHGHTEVYKVLINGGAKVSAMEEDARASEQASLTPAAAA